MERNIIRIISDFNIEPLAGFLKNESVCKEFDIHVSPYGQFNQTLSKHSKSWVDIIWTTPERTLLNFKKAIQFQQISHDDVLADVEDFADRIIFLSKDRYVFISAWVLPIGNIGYGMLDWKDELGLSNLLAKCNLRIAEKISNYNNIFMLPTNNWMIGINNPISEKMWYAAKVPYATSVFETAAKQIAQCISGIKGKSRRLIILDLDNTLWGNVVGENGWKGLRLGGHDHVGEAFKDFQVALKSLSNKGIQLAIVSKNDESVAIEAIEKHPEMVLKLSDFVGWRINWNDKASNVLEVINELNLGLDSAVFIDDNPAERIRVSEAFNEVFVPEWPNNPTMYVSALLSLGCFENPIISSEDRERKEMYVNERSRRKAKHNVKGAEEWLKKLCTKVNATPIDLNNIERVTQLFNKTNQLNLSTRRLSEKEIIEWASKKNHTMMAISVSDQFGDMGLVGVISVEAINEKGRMIDFVLSCRVMGRKVEETLIHLAVVEIAKLGAKKMEICYLPTDRNRPTLEVLNKSNLKKIKPFEFEVDIEDGFEKPNLISLNIYG